MTKKPYLCHITDKDGNYRQVVLDGIVELKQFLRSNNLHFGNYELSYLGNHSIAYQNKEGVSFEVEVLFTANYLEEDSCKYIPMTLFMKKYNHCRRSVSQAIANGKVKSIKKGSFRYVEDKDFKKYERK